VRSLERSGTCHFEVVESMDHSLFNFTGRAALIKLFTAQVTEKLIPEFGRALTRKPEKVVRPPVSVSPLDGSKNRLSRLQTGLQSAEGVSRSSVRALRIEPSDSKVLLLSMCLRELTRQKNPQARASRSLA